MIKPLTIVCTARMGHGTFEAKFIPLTQLEFIKHIRVLRKDEGPKIDKVIYRTLPGICKIPLFNLIITPWLLIHEVKKSNADLILAYHYLPHFFFAYIAHLLSNKPFVIAQTGTDVEELAARPIKGCLLRHVVRRASAFNVPGLSTYQFWLSVGVAKERLRVLHSTIDTDLFKPSSSEKSFDFIFVGRLTEVKRLDKLIKAASRVVLLYPELKICIVGSGHLEAELKTMVEGFGLCEVFDFMGLQKDIFEWLNKAHSFVMMSDSEGLPCAMMEAMSCGLICIGPMVNNMGDLIIQNETGFGFDTHNINQLADIMMQVQKTREQLNPMRIAARNLIIANHSYNVAKKMWHELLRSIVNDE